MKQSVFAMVVGFFALSAWGSDVNQQAYQIKQLARDIKIELKDVKMSKQTRDSISTMLGQIFSNAKTIETISDPASSQNRPTFQERASSISFEDQIRVYMNAGPNSRGVNYRALFIAQKYGVPNKEYYGYGPTKSVAIEVARQKCKAGETGYGGNPEYCNKPDSVEFLP